MQNGKTFYGSCEIIFNNKKNHVKRESQYILIDPDPFGKSGIDEYNRGLIVGVN